jgi:mono/diheme cytochrome c family protein
MAAEQGVGKMNEKMAMTYLKPPTAAIRPLLSALLALWLTTNPVAYAQGPLLQIPKPSAGLMPNPALGKKLYAANCAACHGQDLNGSSKGPPMLHKVYEPSHHGDVAFQMAANNGVRAHHWHFGDMQPVPAVTPDDVAHITAFIRAQQRNSGIR